MPETLFDLSTVAANPWRRDLDAKHVRGSDTSQIAAELIKPKAGSQRAAVLLAIKNAQGLTDEEIADRCNLSPSSARPRRVELVEAGLVVDSGNRRETKSGRTAVVWVVA